MKKPNHSNDNSEQNYDPATGKYVSDESAGKPNLVDDALTASQGEGDKGPVQESQSPSGDEVDDVDDDWDWDEDEEDEGGGNWFTPGVEKELRGYFAKYGVSDDQIEGVLQCLQSADPEIGEAYANTFLLDSPYGKFLKVGGLDNDDYKYSAGLHEVFLGTKPDGSIDIKCEDVDGFVSYESFLHEVAHAMDWNSRGRSYSDRRLISHGLDGIMAQDVDAFGGLDKYKEFLSGYITEFMAKKKDALAKVKAERGDAGYETALQVEYSRAVSSIYALVDYVNIAMENPYANCYSPAFKDPLTGEVNKNCDALGHYYGYYLEGIDTGVEIYAEIMQAVMTRPDTAKLYEKVIPNTLKEAKERAKKIYE